MSLPRSPMELDSVMVGFEGSTFERKIRGKEMVGAATTTLPTEACPHHPLNAIMHPLQSLLSQETLIFRTALVHWTLRYWQKPAISAAVLIGPSRDQH